MCKKLLKILFCSVLFLSLPCWNALMNLTWGLPLQLNKQAFTGGQLCECTTRIYPKSPVKAPMTKDFNRIGCCCPFGFEEPESWIHCTQTLDNRLQEHHTLYGGILSFGFQLCPISHVMCLSKTKRNQLFFASLSLVTNCICNNVFAAGMFLTVLGYRRVLLTTSRIGQLFKMGLKRHLVVVIT